MKGTAIKTKRLRTIQLVAVIFLTVSGGPYGLEPLLSYAGSSSLLFLLIVPILWDIPSIFMVLELNSMMPVTGGYYQWVKKALGLRFAFYEGWWTWLYTFVDLAIYPVLFVEYASFFFPSIVPYKIPVCLCVIWVSALINIRGIVMVGKTALLLGIAVLIPFLILFIKIFFFSHGNVPIPAPSFKGMSFSATGMALYTVMWNFIGWDNATTYAEEVEKPVRAYLRSTLIAFACIFTIYLLAVIAAQVSGVNTNTLSDQGFPYLGVAIGSKWLGVLIAAGGMASALGLFSSVLLSVSRVPKVMSDDGLLPKKLHELHPKFNTPYVSIIICSLVVSVMILWKFEDLLLIDVTVYGAGLLLEFISLIVLRIKMPDAHRPFKIPLNVVGLSLMTLIPATVLIIALAGAFLSEGNQKLAPALFALAALVSAEVFWQLDRFFGKR